MKKLLLGLFLFIPSVQSRAEYNRNRDAIGKSSMTSVANVSTALSTAPSFIRYVTFSGVQPCTVTVFNAQLFTADVTSKAQVYWPGSLVTPATIGLDVFNGSGTIIHKEGLCNAVYNWDWIVRPSYTNPLNEGN